MAREHIIYDPRAYMYGMDMVKEHIIYDPRAYLDTIYGQGYGSISGAYISIYGQGYGSISGAYISVYGQVYATTSGAYISYMVDDHTLYGHGAYKARNIWSQTIYYMVSEHIWKEYMVTDMVAYMEHRYGQVYARRAYPKYMVDEHIIYGHRAYIPEGSASIYASI